MACDLHVSPVRTAARSVFRVALGVLPGTGGAQRFAASSAPFKAIELMATGGAFSMEQAQEFRNRQQIF